MDERRRGGTWATVGCFAGALLTGLGMIVYVWATGQWGNGEFTMGLGPTATAGGILGFVIGWLLAWLLPRSR